MKKLYLIAITFLFPWLIAAQQTEYNRKGDEALRKKDFNDARLYYSEGIPNCDMYSIDRLTAIWKDNTALRPSLHNLMGRCLNCLNNGAARSDSTAMNMLILYYTEGIGTARSEAMSAHWTNELNNLRKPEVVETPIYSGSKRPKQTTRYFVGYAFSLQTPIGITVGGIGERFGAYLRFKTNAAFHKYEGETNFFILDDGKENPPVADEYLRREEQMRNTLSVTSGFIVRCNSMLALSIGAGYFKNDKIFRYAQLDDAGEIINNNRYFKVKNHSFSGLATEADSIWEIGQLYVTTGIGCHISNKTYIDFNIGAGIFF